ncbi:MAG: glycosyltransferase family 39 protein [Deltaproteobacteria bacterium]|nr:glycosyltransferase family 39 protein [Deltaproteobacteria bacterium]
MNPAFSRRAFWTLLAAVTAFRLFYIGWVELAPDEAYYFTWSRDLQWGYYDHPPLVGFLIRAFTALGGSGEFGVRWGWVLMGALLTFCLYRTGQEMFASQRAGFFSALLPTVVLLAATGAIIVTPDGPQALFWALAIYSVYRAVERERASWWYLAGIAFGWGLLSKYTMILLAPAIFFFLLSSARGRPWLRRKEPYLALFLGLLIFSPVILWNSQHQWVSFRFQISHGLELKRAAGWKTFGDFWAGQAGIISPLLFLALLWAMARGAAEGFGRRKDHLLLLFWTSVPILLFFAIVSLRSKVEANWPALAYLPAGVGLAGIASERWVGWGRGKKALAWAVLLSSLLLTALAHVQPLYPIVPLSASKDPTSQLSGWRTLGERLRSAARSAPGEVFLLTPRHQLVGEGMFYTGGRIPIYQWDAPWRINHLSAQNAPPRGSQAIFFTEGGNDLPQGVASLFDSCERLETVIVRRDSSPVRSHPIWRCSGFKGMR